MDTKTADIFVKVYAVLFWLGALFGLIGGVGLLVGGSLFGGMVAGMGEIPGLGAAMGGLFIVFAIIMLGLAVLEFFIGLHLWQHKNWARIAALVFSALGVLSILGLNIIGFIIGAFGVYLFGFDAGAKSLFK